MGLSTAVKYSLAILTATALTAGCTNAPTTSTVTTTPASGADSWDSRLERARKTEGTKLIQYDAQPKYANWGGITKHFLQTYGVEVPPDNKGSSATLEALTAERASTPADVAYYSAVVAAEAGAVDGVHQPYKPAGWEKIPEDCKDPAGRWFCVHWGTIAFVVNTKALEKAKAPVPKCWKDLLDRKYKGLVAYDDPTVHGTAWEAIFAANLAMGGTSTDFAPGIDYLKKLDANIKSYSKDSSYDLTLKGDVAVWINVDGNGYKMKWEDGGPIEVVIPCEGTGSTALAMGMVRWAKHPELARVYLDWLLSSEAQGLWADSYWHPIIDAYMTAKARERMQPLSGSADLVKSVPIAYKQASAEPLRDLWKANIARTAP